MSASKAAVGTPWIGLFTLAGAVFVSVTSELLPTGLLPQMAEGLGVSQSRIGLLVAIFATMVVVSAVALTGLTARIPRKPLVLGVLVIFAIANFLIAVAPNYEVVVAARVLGGLAQGLFWSVVGAYPGHLLPKEKLARGVAITSAGASAAFVLGVPAGTALGHAVGWQLAFATLGFVVIALALVALRFLPAVEHRHDPVADGVAQATDASPSPRRGWHRNSSVLVIALVFMAVFTLMGGHNIFYTYIVPFFTEVNGFAMEWVSGLLLVNGVAGVLGLVLVGTLWAKFPRTGLIVSIAVTSLAVLTIGLLPLEHVLVIVSLAVWGIAMAAPPALLQTKMLQTVPPRVRDIAAAVMTTGFNLGIATGALLGSGVLESAGLGALPLVGAAVIGLCFVLVLFGERVVRPVSRAG